LAGLLAGIVAISVASGSFLLQRAGADRAADRASARLWAEVDVERAIETYRYRHGAYPTSLQAVAKSGIPLPKDADANWSYRVTASSFRLDPAQD
jgi:type II secretory pathway pseudopilin PulG